MQVLDFFRHPWILMLLVAPAALIFWIWSRKGRSVALPFDHAPRVASSRLRPALRVAESMPSIALAFAILLLAGPQKWDVPRTKRALTNIQFCVDVSGSMTSPFGEGTRYDGAMKAIDKFLDFRKGDSFGLTFFGDNFIHWCPLTADPSASVAIVSATYAHQHGLQVGSTIHVAGKKLKVIGIANVSSGAADVYLPLATAQKLADLKGKITTVFVSVSSASHVSTVAACGSPWPGSAIRTNRCASSPGSCSCW